MPSNTSSTDTDTLRVFLNQEAIKQLIPNEQARMAIYDVINDAYFNLSEEERNNPDHITNCINKLKHRLERYNALNHAGYLTASLLRQLLFRIMIGMVQAAHCLARMVLAAAEIAVAFMVLALAAMSILVVNTAILLFTSPFILLAPCTVLLTMLFIILGISILTAPAVVLLAAAVTLSMLGTFVLGPTFALMAMAVAANSFVTGVSVSALIGYGAYRILLDVCQFMTYGREVIDRFFDAFIACLKSEYQASNNEQAMQRQSDEIDIGAVESKLRYQFFSQSGVLSALETTDSSPAQEWDDNDADAKNSEPAFFRVAE